MLHVPSMEGLGLAAFAVMPSEIAQRKSFVSIGSVCTVAGQMYEACDARVGAAAVAGPQRWKWRGSLESGAMPTEECSILGLR